MTTSTTAMDETPTLTADDLRAEAVTTSITRAAEYLGVSRAFAYDLARRGELPVVNLGPNRMRVRTAGLAQMLGIEL